MNFCQSVVIAKIHFEPVIPDKDRNPGDSLFLDFITWRRHVKTHLQSWKLYWQVQPGSHDLSIFPFPRKEITWERSWVLFGNVRLEFEDVLYGNHRNTVPFFSRNQYSTEIMLLQLKYYYY